MYSMTDTLSLQKLMILYHENKKFTISWPHLINGRSMYNNL